MLYTKEFDVQNFEFWAGAKRKTEKLGYDELEALGELIELTFPDDPDYQPTETDINEYVWFDVQYITYDTYGVPQCGCDIQFHTDDDFMGDDEFMERVKDGYARIVEF